MGGSEYYRRSNKRAAASSAGLVRRHNDDILIQGIPSAIVVANGVVAVDLRVRDCDVLRRSAARNAARAENVAITSKQACDGRTDYDKSSNGETTPHVFGSFSNRTVSMRVHAFGILVLVWAGWGSSGCGKCSDAPELSELPIVKCEPLSEGSIGCRGLPEEDAGLDADVYPEGCEVRKAYKQGTCGYVDGHCGLVEWLEDGKVVLTYRWVFAL